MEIQMAMANINGQAAIPMLENLRTDSSMAKVNGKKQLLMGNCKQINLKESIMTIRKLDLENSFGLVEINTKAITLMIKDLDMVRCIG